MEPSSQLVKIRVANYFFEEKQVYLNYEDFIRLVKFNEIKVDKKVYYINAKKITQNGLEVVLAYNTTVI